MSSKVILLAEDSPDDVLLMLWAEQKNHLCDPVEVIRDGAKALDCLFARGAYKERDNKELLRIILLDLNLPKSAGLAVLKQVRASELIRYVPVVILTSFEEISDLKAYFRLGANSYIQNPPDFSSFVELVWEIAVYWLTWNTESPA